ncbi:ribbon-helix-helix protein, CopG family [Aeromicrobium alkaliterrae]|uniref:Ribbon-helix-helix protein CopG domain-containing protein n=1 Tax=Aeromicrobium alkaliterrae TaxID=302168 RepID=A0ABP4VTR8_9ACTN
MGRPKSYDVTLKVKVSYTQAAMLDHLSELLGLTRSELVREMLTMDAAAGLMRQANSDGLG